MARTRGTNAVCLPIRFVPAQAQSHIEPSAARTGKGKAAISMTPATFVGLSSPSTTAAEEQTKVPKARERGSGRLRSSARAGRKGGVTGSGIRKSVRQSGQRCLTEERIQAFALDSPIDTSAPMLADGMVDLSMDLDKQGERAQEVNGTVESIQRIPAKPCSCEQQISSLRRKWMQLSIRVQRSMQQEIIAQVRHERFCEGKSAVRRDIVKYLADQVSVLHDSISVLDTMGSEKAG